MKKFAISEYNITIVCVCIKKNRIEFITNSELIRGKNNVCFWLENGNWKKGS